MSNVQFKAGAGRAEAVLPPDAFPLESFTGVHDNISVRVVILESCREGEEAIKCAFITVDTTTLSDSVSDNILAYLSEQAGIPPANIWLICTHSTGLPHTMAPPHIPNAAEMAKKGALIESAITLAGCEAVDMAVSGIKDAAIFFGRGESHVNINRDIPSAEGWWQGLNPDGPSDKTLSVLKISGADGLPIAVIYNLGLMPEVMEGAVMADGGRLVTADMCGVANRLIESKLGGDAVAMFCQGASGDQAPAKRAKWYETDKAGKLHAVDLHEKGFAIMEALGHTLAEDVLGALEKAGIPLEGPVEAPKWYDMDLVQQRRAGGPGEFRPALTYERINEGTERTGFGIMRFGSLVILGLRPALTCAAARPLLEKSPFPHMLILGGVNGAQKCMPEEEAYQLIKYGSINTRFAQGSAEKYVSALLDKLYEMVK